MIRGLYVAAEGMVARQKAQDVLAANLANVNTSGFKADRPLFETAFQRMLYRVEGTTTTPIGTLSAGALLAATYTDLQPGPMMHTGNPLDVAIEGEGYFAIQTPGGVRYTRSGAFALNAEGMLVTRGGFPVLGAQGAIRVSRNATLQIGEDGAVRSDGKVIDHLLIVQGRLQKDPDGWLVGNATPVPNPRLAVGTLEGSNVNIVREMVEMIEHLRAYETHQKAIQSQDETLGRAINEIARI
ncbi:Flagellar basal-body rod protein FlgG [bacterium HR15]|nr:Flagellar basal-body rod protein FlgG [bacterium HR15]